MHSGWDREAASSSSRTRKAEQVNDVVGVGGVGGGRRRRVGRGEESVGN